MATQILLLEDVDNVGRCGDIVKVRPGFARNFLFPKGKAMIADKQAVRRQAKLQEERRKRASEDRKEAEVLAKRMEEMVVKIAAKVDPEGHLYGSVGASDLVRLLQEQHQVVIEKKNVLIKHPIKSLGTHPIEFRLKEGILATLLLEISAEGQ